MNLQFEGSEHPGSQQFPRPTSRRGARPSSFLLCWLAALALALPRLALGAVPVYGFHDQSTLGGGLSLSNAINEAGAIAGVSDLASGNTAAFRHPTPTTRRLAGTDTLNALPGA